MNNRHDRRTSTIHEIVAKPIRDGHVKLEFQCLKRYFHSSSGNYPKPYIIVDSARVVVHIFSKPNSKENFKS